MRDKTEYYSVDRRGLYRSGCLVLIKERPTSCGQPFLRSHAGHFQETDIHRHILSLFPEGLSPHGWSFVTEYHCPKEIDARWYVASDPTIELVFEYVRRAFYPTRPSRLQSYFAFDSIERARSFHSEGKIYRMLPTNAFRADMTWLNISYQFAVASYNAHQYWRGMASNTPDWEFLLVPPIEVMPTEEAM